MSRLHLVWVGAFLVESMSCVAPVSSYSKENPFPAKILENRRLSGPGSAKETRHFVVDMAGSGLTYQCGDSLGIQPSNREEDVDEVLARLKANGSELVSPPILKLPQAIALREALLNRLSIGKPTRAFVEAMAKRASGCHEQAKLADLLLPTSQERLASFLDEREHIDLLEEFPSAIFSPAEFVGLLRKLLPRLYSIASSPVLHPSSAHLTVAVVRYTTNNRERRGVCSTFLADRVKVGDSLVPAFVSRSHFRLPEDPNRDCIMVGPGTGLAPFRAFIQERAATGATGRNWLFFGDQRRATDFLYEEEWQGYLENKQLTRLDTAFSRDQSHKIYVQDRMRENAAVLWSWLKGGAYFYVCGDARRMARDVDAALQDVVQIQGGFSTAETQTYIAQMKKEKRYQRDVY